MDSSKALCKKIEGLTPEQKHKVESYIDFHFTPDYQDPSIKDAKVKVYDIYTKKISPIINKIEVYKHDFPDDLYAYTETLFRILASASLVDKEKALSIYTHAEEYANVIENYAKIMLLELYIQTIKKYKKILFKFNCKGIMLDSGMSFYDSIRQIFPRIKKGCKISRRLFNRQFKLSYKNCLNMTFCVDGANPELDRILNESLVLAEDTLNTCENKFSKIISNGYSAKFTGKFVPAISIILTILFTTITAFGIYQIIKL